MTTAQRRTVAEMEKRLASARELIEKMRADAHAGMETASDHNSRTFSHGCRCGLDQALQMLTACFDDPGRDWMYQRP